MMGTIVVITAFTACDNKPDDAKEAAEETNEAVIDDRKGENDAQFLVDAADINLMEVHMGRAAATSAMTKAGRPAAVTAPGFSPSGVSYQVSCARNVVAPKVRCRSPMAAVERKRA